MLCATTIPSGYARDALISISTKACRQRILALWLFDGMRGSAPSRAVSISPHVVGFSKTGSVADAVVAWTRGCRAGLLVLTIARFISGRRADVICGWHMRRSVRGGAPGRYIELWTVSICYFGWNILVWLVLC